MYVSRIWFDKIKEINDCVLKLTQYVVVPISQARDKLTLTSIIASFFGLPDELKYDPASWNSMTHGNITVVVVLLTVRYSDLRYYLDVLSDLGPGWRGSRVLVEADTTTGNLR